jgi:hypothetical protein
MAYFTFAKIETGDTYMCAQINEKVDVFICVN